METPRSVVHREPRADHPEVSRHVVGGVTSWYTLPVNRRSNAVVSSIVAPFRIKIRVRGRIVILRLEPDPVDGGFVVSSPSLRGLNSQADTVESAIAHGKEAALALLPEPRRRRHA